MEESIGSGIVSGPYLIMSFGIGAAALFGYLGIALYHRVRLRKLLMVVDQSKKEK